jgi:hypothetical protein
VGVVLVTLAALVGCRKASPPARHPVADLTTAATARADVVELIIPDWQRAQRVRRVYLELAALGYQLDQERAHLAQSRVATGQIKAGELEALLLPPVTESEPTYQRYVDLMLELHTLVSAHELERLNEVR